jgi:hypothetical protein
MDRDNMLDMLQHTLTAAVESIEAAKHLAAYTDLGDTPRRLGRLQDELELIQDYAPLST